MDPRPLALAVPAAVVLAMLVVHSLHALPRRRALAFWAAAAIYGVLRGRVLHAVVEGGLGASFPYRIERPLAPVFGVPLQEIAGWAIVGYLAWWLGDRYAARAGDPRPLFVQLAWACLFLGAASWAIEAGAVAAGWWHWTVPVRWPLLGNVPFIGLVDWFFVGTDFLLPFLALSSASLRRVRWRWLTLAAFPLHFAAHLSVEPPFSWWPIPLLHLAHWLLLGLVLAAAARSRHAGATFSEPTGRARRLPLAALGLIAADLALVETLVADRPTLVLTLLPMAAVVAVALRPAWGRGLAAGGVLGAPFAPSLALAAVPAAADFGLRRLRDAGRRSTMVAIAALALLAGVLHHRAALAERDLVARLERAIAARDRGELAGAERELEAAAERHPGAHAPSYLLGELRYRTGRPDDAARALADAIAVKPDHLPSFRMRAVALLQAARPAEALATARLGLRVAPDDAELRYLERRSSGAGVATWPEFERYEPAAAERVAAIAFEVGDVAGAAGLLDRALARWPRHRAFYSKRIRLAMATGDRAGAERVLALWRLRFPDDPELARAAAAIERSSPREASP